jgi:hypothetical protein
VSNAIIDSIDWGGMYALRRDIPINPALPQTIAECEAAIIPLNEEAAAIANNLRGIDRGYGEWGRQTSALKAIEDQLVNLERQIEGLKGGWEYLRPPFWRLRMLPDLPQHIPAIKRLGHEILKQYPGLIPPEITIQLQNYKIQIDALRQRAEWEAEFGPWTEEREAEYLEYRGRQR